MSVLLIDGNKNYSVNETARLFSEIAGEQIATSKIRYLINAGHLQGFRVLGAVRIKGEELKRYADKELIRPL